MRVKERLVPPGRGIIVTLDQPCTILWHLHHDDPDIIPVSPLHLVNKVIIGQSHDSCTLIIYRLLFGIISR